VSEAVSRVRASDRVVVVVDQQLLPTGSFFFDTTRVHPSEFCSPQSLTLENEKCFPTKHARHRTERERDETKEDERKE
jgi:hypothetical protein